MVIQARPVIQMDLDGNFISEFESIKLAAKQFGGTNNSAAGIQQACTIRSFNSNTGFKKKPHSNKSQGYRWKYK